MSVHHDRGAWVVRWRQAAAEPCGEGAAYASDLEAARALRAADGRRSSTPSVYPYETPPGSAGATATATRAAGPPAGAAF